MKQYIRFWIGLLVVAPIAIAAYTLALGIGKERAVNRLGRLVTWYAKSLQQFFPPRINDASEFDLFKERAQPHSPLYKLWSILYDYPVECPDDDSVLLVVTNCPFADALKLVNLHELGESMCQGDWEVARDNAHKWTFERNGTIGTGCEVCDFKYIRIRES